MPVARFRVTYSLLSPALQPPTTILDTAYGVRMDSVMNKAYAMLDQGMIPDVVLRPVIRSLCRERLGHIGAETVGQAHENKMDYIAGLKKRETIAIETDTANEQHYEVSTAFIQACLGPRLKYSCCLYPTGKETLAEAEELMLKSYCEKAKLGDGDGEGLHILDLGCGWGSLGLYLAEKYPKAKITMLSNSSTQKIHIDGVAGVKGFTNIEVHTGDVNVYDFASGPNQKSFDRIMSIEMFEHMKNYGMLLKKVSSWLKPNSESFGGEALLFVHIFCHKNSPYHYEDGDGWMTKNFFAGGTMPSLDLFTYFQEDLILQRSWWLNGTHYGRTSEAWLKTQDSHGNEALAELERNAVAMGYDKSKGTKTFYQFRVFFLAVAEFFALDKGEQWGVGHYLFKGRK